MATAQIGNLLWHLRAIASRADGPVRTDGELLECFLARRDDDAFAALVRRHGPMVLGVCRRTLRNEADAEDAFQATFLVLARKAGTVRPRHLVGHWLYGVAYNTARKARLGDRRRRDREHRAGCDRASVTAATEPRDSIPELLDQELNRLPDRYRAAVVLCDLEGQPLQEAARRLDCPLGTVASRLARARDLLRRNLLRRGLTCAAIGAALAPAVVPTALRASTARAGTLFAAGVTDSVPATVISLTEGVLQTMFVSKMKLVAAIVVALGLVISGTGTWTTPAQAEQPKPEKPVKKTDEKKPEKPAPDKPAKPDAAKPPAFGGVVKSVDADKGSLTVEVTKGDNTSERTVPVGKDAKVLLDGKKANLSDLKPGFRVNIKLGEDRTTAQSVGAEGPTLTGELKAVDVDKHTVRVSVTTHPDPTDKKKTATEEKTLKVADDVQVVIQGEKKKATLADLKTGTSVVVRVSADGERVFAISSPAKGADGPTLVGELKAVAVDKKTLTVAVKVLTDKTDKSSAKIEEKTIKVADDAKIAVEGKKPATLSDLKTGSSVAIHMSKDGERAIAISSSTKGAGGDKKPEKPAKPGGEKPNTEKPVKPDAEKPGVKKPVKGDGDE